MRYDAPVQIKRSERHLKTERGVVTKTALLFATAVSNTVLALLNPSQKLLAKIEGKTLIEMAEEAEEWIEESDTEELVRTGLRWGGTAATSLFTGLLAWGFMFGARKRPEVSPAVSRSVLGAQLGSALGMQVYVRLRYPDLGKEGSRMPKIDPELIQAGRVIAWGTCLYLWYLFLMRVRSANS